MYWKVFVTLNYYLDQGFSSNTETFVYNFKDIDVFSTVDAMNYHQ